MEVPRGFTRCNECDGMSKWCSLCAACPSCSGSGLLPAEKLREEAAMELHDNDPVYSPPYWSDCNEDHRKWYFAQADAVLRKVAEHLARENN